MIRFHELARGWLGQARRRHEDARARELALHDPLTGLPNRRKLVELLPDLLSEAAPARPVALVTAVVADTGRFASVDFRGRPVDDELLVAVAGVLAHEVGPAGLVVRLGWNEFALVLGGADDEHLAYRLSSLLEMLEEPFAIEGRHISVGVAFGVALAPFDGIDAETILRRAGAARDRAERNGWGKFAFFSKGVDDWAPRRRTLPMDRALH